MSDDFDADLSHPLAEYRIAVVATPYPRWKYHVALVINSEAPWVGVEPTVQEGDQLAAYLEYRLRWYNDHWRAKMRERALDVDSGVNTFTFLKRPDGSWCYRAMTWRHGPPLWPPPDKEPMSLLALLDHINSVAGEPLERWAEFTANHPALSAGCGDE